jgi:predicted RNA binding protein YcfA (HicA-like mRNA interferase family)
MGLRDLPLAGGARHVAAFKHAGWVVVRIKGAHHIMERDGVENHLAVPCHKGTDMSRALLSGLIDAAGMTEADYCDHFHKRIPRVDP